MNLAVILEIIQMATSLASNLTTGTAHDQLVTSVALEALALKVNEAHQQFVGEPLDVSIFTPEAHIE